MTFQGLVSYCSGVEERLVRVAVSERTGRGPKKGKKKCVRGMSVVSHTGRFAYKSIRIQVDSHTSRSFRRHDLGRFVYTEVVSPTIRIADIKVDSHTQFESIRIRNLSRFAYAIWVDSQTKKSFASVFKFEVILYIGNITQGGLLRTPRLSFWILLALIKNGQATLKKRKQVPASVIHFKLIFRTPKKTSKSVPLHLEKILLKLLVLSPLLSAWLFIFILAFMHSKQWSEKQKTFLSM